MTWGQTTRTIKISDKISPAFIPFWRACRSHLYKVLKGGRNSGKSTSISYRIVYELMRYPINALVVRKVDNTLETSVVEQLRTAIMELGVDPLWRYLKSPQRLIFTPTGNQIIFRGADDPRKLRSLKTSEYPIAILWIEEVDEFRTEDEVDMIVNSVLRAELPGDLQYSIFFSYNPPKRKQSWVNKRFSSINTSPNVYIHHSTYHDNPHVSESFRQEMEELKVRNEARYRWMALGEAIGGGVVPFENLVFRRISDAEYASFDNIRNGIDWGYAADAYAYTRWHYDKTRRMIYAMDEHYGVKISNREAAIWLRSKGYHAERIIADSAEPKSIAEMRNDHGINRIVGAKKGPGSVEFGEKWLDDLNAIIIDPHRTPNIAQEFEAIDYQVDRHGNIRSKLIDEDNHTIDSCRYAMEDDMSATGIRFLK